MRLRRPARWLRRNRSDRRDELTQSSSPIWAISIGLLYAGDQVGAIVSAPGLAALPCGEGKGQLQRAPDLSQCQGESGRGRGGDGFSLRSCQARGAAV